MTESALTEATEATETTPPPKPTYIEQKLPTEKKQECRDILRTLNEWGLTQRQKLFLIYLLSLELENTETMRALAAVIAERHENVTDGKLAVPPPTKKLVLR